jgi:hypothetical protein
VCGHTDAENVWNLKPGNGISCILSIQICSKIYAKYTCIWNKRRKKRTKNEKLFTIIYHYLVVEKRNNLKNLLSVYLFVILRWFVCVNLGKRDFCWGGKMWFRGGGGAQGGTEGIPPPPQLVC